MKIDTLANILDDLLSKVQKKILALNFSALNGSDVKL